MLKNLFFKKIIFIALLFFLLIIPISTLAASLQISKFIYQGKASKEYVQLENISERTINLKDWQIKNSTDKKYVFPAIKLKSEQKITLYTSKGQNKLSGKDKKIYWGREKAVWRDKGDVLTLKSPKNKTILTRRYGDKKTKETTFGKKVYFIHHSTGEIYWNGGMEKALEDHGYTGSAPWWDGGTDPQDFPTLFNDANNWDILNNYDIIIFKSCFPASDITSDSMLADYKTWYKELYNVYRAHSDKLFVPMSTPPLLESHTSYSAAQRAIAFENWLIGDYKNNYNGNNLAPFGLHTLLDDDSGYLHSDFISDPNDDHPNSHSGEVVGEAMWKHLDSVDN